jgi:hypothetical protein
MLEGLQLVKRDVRLKTVMRIHLEWNAFGYNHVQ